mgnify:CR=1 FL=1
MDCLAWSDGSKPIRSSRNDKFSSEPIQAHVPEPIQTHVPEPIQAHVPEPDLFKSMPHTDYNAMFRPCGYREEVYTKISEREPIEQVSQNPFFGKTNYINHLNDEHHFLRPQNKYNEFKS